MSTKLSAGRVRSTYEFIKASRNHYSVQAMCRVLGVAPSGYYEWVTHPISDRAQEDARLLRLIRASFTASQGIYGACPSRIAVRPRLEAGPGPCSARPNAHGSARHG